MCPADGRVGNGVTVVMVLADIPIGSPAHEGAEVVFILASFSPFSVLEGLLLWGVGDGQEGGVPPPVLC
jgi:hypothetical protein